MILAVKRATYVEVKEKPELFFSPQLDLNSDLCNARAML